jgi:hypothetical protein
MEAIKNKQRIEILQKAKESVHWEYSYICIVINKTLYENKVIRAETYFKNSAMDTTLMFFPELLKYKPAGVDLHNPYGWFGCPFKPGVEQKRKRVFLALCEEIEQLGDDAEIEIEIAEADPF